ncbi:MAG: AAA family ATPase, partial [Acidobacteriota bacterium]
MRIESVRAVAFGPLSEATLDLAPGLNIVYGPNESGKSSWHAAVYAALCGMRRRRGRSKEDQAFRDRYCPWDRDEWEVSAKILLADDRRIELRHDFAGGVEAEAIDLGLARDVSGEIIHEGAPDGSRWLGLDRRSFLATACVRQADVLGIAKDSKLLQEHLQRAASTAGTDSTAARALWIIEEFQREQVGTDRPNSRKPLRRAMDRRREAEAALAEGDGLVAQV